MKTKNYLFMGFMPLFLGFTFYLIGMILSLLLENSQLSSILITILSIGFVGLWGALGYKIGKDEGVSLKNIFYIHIISIILIIIFITFNSFDIIMLLAELFFLPASQLLSDLLHKGTYASVLMGFIVMILVFSMGMLSSKKI